MCFARVQRRNWVSRIFSQNVKWRLRDGTNGSSPGRPSQRTLVTFPPPPRDGPFPEKRGIVDTCLFRPRLGGQFWGLLTRPSISHTLALGHGPDLRGSYKSRVGSTSFYETLFNPHFPKRLLLKFRYRQVHPTGAVDTPHSLWKEVGGPKNPPRRKTEVCKRSRSLTYTPLSTS